MDINKLIISSPAIVKPSVENVIESKNNIIKEILEITAMGLSHKSWRWKPVGIKEWILGKYYLDLEDTIRPVVLSDICTFFESSDRNPWHRNYDEAAFCEGIGSGKSYKTGIIATYFEHLLLCLRSPQQYFWIDKVSKIAIMNMSISEANARRVIFSEISNRIQSCKWFTDKPWELKDSRMPDPRCLSELRFKNNTFIIPGSSNWRTAVGYHIFVGIIDEAGNLRNTDRSDYAEDIYHALQRRLGSRFESQGAIIMAGSPLYEKDFLEKKIAEGQEKDSRVYSVRRSLWESKYQDWKGEFFWSDIITKQVFDVKPNPMTAEIVEIPKVPFLYKSFKANPTKAWRDFGALPSATLCSFFESPKIVEDNVNQSRTEDPMDALGRFKPWFKPIDMRAPHVIHVDLGMTHDACGLALGHYAGMTTEGGCKIYIDLMLRLQGSPDAPIKLEKVRQYIYTLKGLGFNITLISFDGWQSSDSLQILEGKGYNTKLLSIDRTIIPYGNLKSAIVENRLDYYCVPNEADGDSASEYFVKECMRLEEIKGKKVDHIPGGSKDISDAVAGVTHNIIEEYGMGTAVGVGII